MKRTMALTALLAGAWAELAGAGEPRVGITFAAAQGTTVGAVVRITDRLTSRSAFRFPSWGGAVAEFDLTGDLLRSHAFVPYLGAGVELVADGTGGTERTESRALVGVRHDPTRHVRLFTEGVWHRHLGGATGPQDKDVEIRLAAGVAVLF
jgi:hypothetical protein